MKAKDVNKLLSQGERALDTGRASVAIRKLNEVLTINKDSIDAHFYLALAYRKQGNLPKAKSHAKRVLRLNPKEANARLNLGVIEADLGFESKATRNYKKELALHPRCFEAHYNLGRAYIHRSQWKEALRHLLVCWKNKHPGKLRDEFLALAAQHSGDAAIEEKVYLRRLRYSPEDGWALNNLGCLRNDQGRSTIARRLFEKCLKIRPSDRKAKNNLRYTLEKIKKQRKNT